MIDIIFKPLFISRSSISELNKKITHFNKNIKNIFKMYKKYNTLLNSINFIHSFEFESVDDISKLQVSNGICLINNKDCSKYFNNYLQQYIVKYRYYNFRINETIEQFINLILKDLYYNITPILHVPASKKSWFQELINTHQEHIPWHSIIYNKGLDIEFIPKFKNMNIEFVEGSLSNTIIEMTPPNYLMVEENIDTKDLNTKILAFLENNHIGFT